VKLCLICIPADVYIKMVHFLCKGQQQQQQQKQQQQQEQQLQQQEQQQPKKTSLEEEGGSSSFKTICNIKERERREVRACEKGDQDLQLGGQGQIVPSILTEGKEPELHPDSGQDAHERDAKHLRVSKDGGNSKHIHFGQDRGGSPPDKLGDNNNTESQVVARLDEAHRRMEEAKKCLSNLERRGPGELVEIEQLRRDVRRAQLEREEAEKLGRGARQELNQIRQILMGAQTEATRVAIENQRLRGQVEDAEARYESFFYPAAGNEAALRLAAQARHESFSYSEDGDTPTTLSDPATQHTNTLTLAELASPDKATKEGPAGRARAAGGDGAGNGGCFQTAGAATVASACMTDRRGSMIDSLLSAAEKESGAVAKASRVSDTIQDPVTIEGDIGTSASDLTDSTWCQRAGQDGLVRLSEWVVKTSGSGLGRPKQGKEGMKDGLLTSYTSPIAHLTLL
jgi:hypothetical protein